MRETVLSPWRKYFVQTLGVWGICCVLAMMLLDGGRAALIYAIGSFVFWNVVAACSFFRRKPTKGEILIYRIGPAVLFIAAVLVAQLRPS